MATVLVSLVVRFDFATVQPSLPYVILCVSVPSRYEENLKLGAFYGAEIEMDVLPSLHQIKKKLPFRNRIDH